MLRLLPLLVLSLLTYSCLDDEFDEIDVASNPFATDTPKFTLVEFDHTVVTGSTRGDIQMTLETIYPLLNDAQIGELDVIAIGGSGLGRGLERPLDATVIQIGFQRLDIENCYFFSFRTNDNQNLGLTEICIPPQ